LQSPVLALARAVGKAAATASRPADQALRVFPIACIDYNDTTLAERPGYDPYHAERPQSQPHRESEANPLAPLLREQRGRGERSHEELVAIIRKELAAYMERKQLTRYSPDPVAAMRDRFISALTDLELAQNPELANAPRHEMPHAQLLMAWDFISQPYYKSAHLRGLTESAVKEDARHLGHTITLDPNEGKLLSAMAEAVGIPNPFGQTTQEKKESK
jgi:hypothetical protein